MSATLTQRVWRWGVWYGQHNRAEQGFVLVGFTHHCGAATLIEDFEGFDGSCCSGCRTEISRPYGECTPLYEAKEASDG